MKIKTFLIGSVVSFTMSVDALITVAPAWENDQAVELEYCYLPDSGLKEEEGEVGMHVARGRAVFPIPLGETVFAVLGLDYEGLFVGYRNLTFTYTDPSGKTFTEDDLPSALHAADAIVGLGVGLTDRLDLYGEFRPGVHSDFKEFDRKDMYYQGGLMILYEFSDEFSACLGAYYDDVFGQPELFPVVGVQWEISDDVALDALLPDYCEIYYRAASWLNLGLQATDEGHQFRLSENVPWENTVAKYTQILAGPYLDLFAGEHLVFRLEGGIALSREFEFRDDDSSQKLYNGDLKEVGYAGLSVGLAF